MCNYCNTHTQKLKNTREKETQTAKCVNMWFANVPSTYRRIVYHHHPRHDRAKGIVGRTIILAADLSQSPQRQQRWWWWREICDSDQHNVWRDECTICASVQQSAREVSNHVRNINVPLRFAWGRVFLRQALLSYPPLGKCLVPTRSTTHFSSSSGLARWLSKTRILLRCSVGLELGIVFFSYDAGAGLWRLMMIVPQQTRSFGVDQSASSIHTRIKRVDIWMWRRAAAKESFVAMLLFTLAIVHGLWKKKPLLLALIFFSLFEKCIWWFLIVRLFSVYVLRWWWFWPRSSLANGLHDVTDECRAHLQRSKGFGHGDRVRESRWCPMRSNICKLRAQSRQPYGLCVQIITIKVIVCAI